MLCSLLLTVATCATVIFAHGHVQEYTIDGTTYPAFDPQHDYDAKWNAKRIEWGFNKAKGNVGPVENVALPEIACRFNPLKEPEAQAEARAGAEIEFKWLDWFGNHKGPVITHMGALPQSGNVTDVEFFKIHEDGYDAATGQFGSDHLVKNDNRIKVTIPSDIKAGTYVVRHEIISLHNALNDDYIKKISGAQFYPQCVKVRITGDGTATPAGTKFPGTYKWDDKGILFNVYYRPNQYFVPGGPVYKPTSVSPPKGPAPAVKEGTKASLQPEYVQVRAKTDKMWESAVQRDVAAHPGGGGCVWAPGASPKTAKCNPTNPGDPKYKGLGQPEESPLYVDWDHSSRKSIGRGPVVKYLFDPNGPRAEEKAKTSASKKGVRRRRRF